MPKPFSLQRHQEWKERILEQRASGFSIQRWCSQNDITIHSFYYWKQKLFPKANIDKSCFKEITPEAGHSGITIKYLDFSINIDQKFDVYTLKECLEVLKELKC